VQKGGSVQGVLNGLNLVLDLAVPEHHEEGGTFVVPGHARIADEFWGQILILAPAQESRSDPALIPA
jgi:hypothetical protein